MSVMPRQSVEGIFDEATDAAVRRRWAVLAEAGLPSQASHRGQSNSPHLTLSVAERLPAAVEQSLRLQSAVAAAMAGGEGVADLVLPGRWTPHVTLARGVDRGQLSAVVEALGRLDELEGSITSLRRWNPVERRVWALGADPALPTMEA